MEVLKELYSTANSMNAMHANIPRKLAYYSRSLVAGEFDKDTGNI